LKHPPLEITEIRIKLVGDGRSRLKAYCSVTFADQFAVRDLKIVEGARGAFVAMPSRKVSDHCPQCRGKNHLRAAFCNQCGAQLDSSRAERLAPGNDGRVRLHADLAHPINSQTRLRLHRAVLAAYADELEKSKQADYKPATFDDLDLLDDLLDEDYLQELQRRQEQRDARHSEPGSSSSGDGDEFGAAGQV
jgi:stage V sporulation protein G